MKGNVAVVVYEVVSGMDSKMDRVVMRERRRWSECVGAGVGSVDGVSRAGTW